MGGDASPPPACVSIESTVGTREPGRLEALLTTETQLSGSQVSPEPCRARRVPGSLRSESSQPAPPSLCFASFTPDAGFSSWLCPWRLLGGLCLLPAWTSSLPECARRALPGLSLSGKVFRQVPVHRPPDDHPSSCRALPSGRPAGNALLSPVCTHATHACALTAHLRRQRCALTGTRLPPPLPGSSSQSSRHLPSQPPHLASLINYFWPRWVFLATHGHLTAVLLLLGSAGSAVWPQ